MKISFQKAKKKHSDKTKLRTAFYNEEGAVDLGSIMVGIIVIGLIGGVIAATVFAVIPWAQDNAAKQQLDSIVAAQSAYKGLSSGVPPAVPTGHTPNTYADSRSLAEANLLSNENSSYCTIVTDNGQGYEAFAKSSSGKYWTVNHGNTRPMEAPSDALPIECEDLKPAYTDPSPLLTKLTYKCDVTTEIVLPIKDRITGGTAKWSDGTTQTIPAGNDPFKKTLSAGVTYTLSYEGTYSLFSNGFNGTNSNTCLRSVDHWGQETKVTNASNAFHGAVNLTDMPANIPHTITNMSYMFSEVSKINDPDIARWKTGNVTDMSGMFNNAKAFNQPLNHWNVSKVTNMRVMFAGASSFNQPLNNWDVSKVTNMKSMFGNNHIFSQDLSSWNTVAVTDGTTFAPESFPASYLPPRTSK